MLPKHTSKQNKTKTQKTKTLWDSNLDYTAHWCWRPKEKKWVWRRKLTKTNCEPFTKGWGALTAGKDQAAIKTQAEKKNATRAYRVATNWTRAILCTVQPP